MRMVKVETEVVGYEFKDLSEVNRAKLYMSYLQILLDNMKECIDELPKMSLTDEGITEYLSGITMKDTEDFYNDNAFIFDKYGNILNEI